MAMIPAYAKPYPDELLYSVIGRTAERCAVDIETFIKKYLGNPTAHGNHIVPDIRWEFPAFCRNIPADVSMKDLYLSTTTFLFECMVMTDGQQSRYLNTVFRPRDELNPPAGSLFDKVRICPDCARKDAERFGEAYIHRSHQLSGVHTCHIHGTPLLEYHGRRTRELDFDMSDYSAPEAVFEAGDMQAYTAYAQALFEADLGVSAADVKGVVMRRMKKRGYGAADGYKGFVKAFSRWEHEGLWRPYDRAQFLWKNITNLKGMTIENVIPILMFLYPDAGDLIRAFRHGKTILMERSCPVCGMDYCITPFLKKNGWGCPYCDAALREAERFRALVSVGGNGKYEPLGDFRSFREKVPFRHEECGTESLIRPSDFLFSGVRCKCENMVTEADARKAIESSGRFELKKFTPVEKSVTIYAKACGHEFTCRYYAFIKSPFCRTCRSEGLD